MANLGLQVVLGLFLRAARECTARKKAVFSLLVQRAANAVSATAGADDVAWPPGGTGDDVLVEAQALRHRLLAELDTIKVPASSTLFLDHFLTQIPSPMRPLPPPTHAV